MEAVDPILNANNREPGQITDENQDNDMGGHSIEEAVIVQGGLQVYTLDGMLLGHVDEFIIDTTGNLTSFMVNTGNTLGHEMRVLMDWIQTVTRERIQLCITAAEAQLSTLAGERAGKQSHVARGRFGVAPAIRAHAGDTPA
jgi:sporulation protein YlmC with PRC-barrel domain